MFLVVALDHPLRSAGLLAGTVFGLEHTVAVEIHDGVIVRGLILGPPEVELTSEDLPLDLERLEGGLLVLLVGLDESLLPGNPIRGIDGTDGHLRRLRRIGKLPAILLDLDGPQRQRHAGQKGKNRNETLHGYLLARLLNDSTLRALDPPLPIR